jgi:prevent-host-death family protein
MERITVIEAQKRLEVLLDSAQIEPVEITREGRPVAYIISPRDMDELPAIRRRRSESAAEFREWSEWAQASLTPEQRAASAELTDEDVVRMVHELR